ATSGSLPLLTGTFLPGDRIHWLPGNQPSSEFLRRKEIEPNDGLARAAEQHHRRLTAAHRPGDGPPAALALPAGGGRRPAAHDQLQRRHPRATGRTLPRRRGAGERMTSRRALVILLALL